MKLPSSILKAAALKPDKPMFCTHCGTANTRDSKFCKECGESLVTAYAPMASVDPFVQAGLGREEQLQRLLDMAFWHNEAGNLEAALLACQAALALNERCSTAWSLLGCLYERKGDLERAVEAFEVVCALNPDSIADAQKLEALRRGVHVKAVPQPVSYRWVPPALSKYVQDKPSAPLIGAAAAVVVVIALGILSIHPLLVGQPGTANAAGQPNLAAGRSAWSSGENSSIAAGVATTQTPAPPINVPAGAPHTITVGNSAPAMMTAVPPPINRDPFAGTPPLLAVTNGFKPPRNNDGTNTPRESVPPLTLKNLPDSAAVRPLPAPGSGAAAQPAVIATTASVPEHTVVVSNPATDNGSYLSSPDSGQADSSGGSSGDGAAPAPQSFISITVHGEPASQPSDGASNVPPDSGPVRHLVLGANSGASLQQKALIYQQQGDYTHAQAAYQKAIAAYQTQLNSGEDSDAAVRGIQACETGLQICRQSQ